MGEVWKLPLRETSRSLATLLVRKAYLRRPGSVNVNLKPGQVERFLNAQVNRAGDVFEFTHQPLGESPIGAQVLAHHLDIDGRREAEIQNLADHVRGQDVKRHARDIPRANLSRSLRTYSAVG